MSFFRRQCLAHLYCYFKKSTFLRSSEDNFNQDAFLISDFDRIFFTNFTRTLYAWSDSSYSMQLKQIDEAKFKPHEKYSAEVLKIWEKVRINSILKKYKTFDNYEKDVEKIIKEESFESQKYTDWNYLYYDLEKMWTWLSNRDFFVVVNLFERGWPVLRFPLVFFIPHEFEEKYKVVYFNDIKPHEDPFPYYKKKSLNESRGLTDEEFKEREKLRDEILNTDFDYEED